MEDQHRRLLQKHAFRIQTDLTLDAEFLSIFAAHRVFTDANIETIMAKSSNAEKVSEFLIRLPKRGRRAFGVLIEALMQTEQDHIADDLDKFSADEWRVRNGVPTDKPVLPKRTHVIENKDEAIIRSRGLTVEPKVAKECMKDEENYDMVNTVRGRALILNNSTKKGSRFDKINLQNLFEQLGFQHEDMWGQPIRTTLDIQGFEAICTFARNLPVQAHGDVFAFMLMSRGTKESVRFQDGEKTFDEIETLFDGKNCPPLLNKPKLLIFHTYEEDDGDQVDVEYETKLGDENRFEKKEHISESLKEYPGSTETAFLQAGVKTMTLHADSVVAAAPEHGNSAGSAEIMPDARPVSGSNTNESDPQDITPTIVPQKMKHVHEKTDFCTIACHVKDAGAWGDANKGSHFVRDLIFTLLERCHDDHWEDMMTEVTRLQGTRQQEVTRRSTLKKSLYLLPGYAKDAGVA